jgi:hypothetical protein
MMNNTAPILTESHYENNLSNVEDLELKSHRNVQQFCRVIKCHAHNKSNWNQPCVLFKTFFWDEFFCQRFPRQLVAKTSAKCPSTEKEYVTQDVIPNVSY